MKTAFILGTLLFSLSTFAAKVKVDVAGMTCNMCIESITNELKATSKAENITVSLEDKMASFDEVKGKKISDAEIKNAIKKAGYDAVKVSRR